MFEDERKRGAERIRKSGEGNSERGKLALDSQFSDSREELNKKPDKKLEKKHKN